MKARALAHARRNRWALSFADLALLLLGFFVLLQASNGRQHEVVNGVAQEFGAPVAQADRLLASNLFQPGEALLTPAGEQALKAVAAHHRVAQGRIEIRSVGLDPSTNRFDSWDLAAARLGAVARGLAAHGIARERILIRGLDQQSESRAGQQILIRAR